MEGGGHEAQVPHAVDLEGLCERLHVDTRTMVRALRDPHVGHPIDMDAHALETVIARGCQAGRSPAVVPAAAVKRRHTGSSLGRMLAFSEQMRPRAPPLVTLTPDFTSMTPPVVPGSMLPHLASSSGSGGGGDAAGLYAPGVIRGLVVDRTREEILQMRKRIYSGEIDAYGEARPLLRGRAAITISKEPPLGVREHPTPLSAFIVPIDTDKSIVVVEPIPDDLSRQEPPGILPGVTMPDEIKHLEVHITEDEQHHVHVSFLIEFARPILGWVILVVGVVSMAAIGPVIKLMTHNGVSGFLVGGLFMMFTTCALLEGVSAKDVAYLKTRFGFLLLAAAGTISGLGSGCWTLSFSYTSVPQSYLFNSFHPCLIIAWRLLRGNKVVLAEKVGVVCGLAGASLSLLDGGGGRSVPFGDLMAFMSSVSLCFYLLASKKARNHLSLMLNLSFVTFFSALSQSIVGYFLNPGGLTFDAHPHTGVFGWYNPLHFYLWIAITLVTGIGQAGYIGALKYLNPVIVSICMTTEPATATIFAMILLHEGLPSGYTITGGMIIIASSMIVSYFSKHSKENVELELELEDVSETVKQRMQGTPGTHGRRGTPVLGAAANADARSEAVDIEGGGGGRAGEHPLMSPPVPPGPLQNPA